MKIFRKRYQKTLKKSLKININNDDIKEGDKVFINHIVHHSGKKLVIRNLKQRSKSFKLQGSTLSNYGGYLQL